METTGQIHAPAALSLGKRTRYELDGRLCGPPIIVVDSWKENCFRAWQNSKHSSSVSWPVACWSPHRAKYTPAIPVSPTPFSAVCVCVCVCVCVITEGLSSNWPLDCTPVEGALWAVTCNNPEFDGGCVECAKGFFWGQQNIKELFLRGVDVILWKVRDILLASYQLLHSPNRIPPLAYSGFLLSNNRIIFIFLHREDGGRISLRNVCIRPPNRHQKLRYDSSPSSEPQIWCVVLLWTELSISRVDTKQIVDGSDDDN